MKKAIQIQKDIKLKVSNQQFSVPLKEKLSQILEEDRLHQLRRAEDVLAQSSTDRFIS